VVETPKLVIEAFESGLEVDYVIVPSDQHPDPDIAERCDAERVRLFGLAPDAFVHLSDSRTPQPALAVVESPPLEMDGRFESPSGLYLVLVEVSDPGNVGTLLRTAEATGCAGVIVTSQTADVLSPKVVRASAGSILRVLIGEVDVDALADVMAHLGVQVVATAMDGAPYDTVELDASRPVALLLGSEAHGLGESASELAEHVVSIPMAGQVESLNVATAGAVLAFDQARRRRATAD
jgi:TrmH family RNA methyltransferase